ncbi:MAG: thiamine-monophosphate kinase [Planctomycetes bacterium]|nr:thiamine-monophosphate kinase [Planctomycetota bacterium]
MAAAPRTEADLIAWIRGRLGAARSVPVGPGDDAAVVRPRPGSDILVTVDACLEGRHFVLGGPGPGAATPRLAGRKLLARNLSDIAAMAGVPTFAVVSMTLRRDAPPRVAMGMFIGINALAREYGVALVGGDISAWDHPFALALTLLGETRGLRPVRRGGTRPGHRLFVTGALGGSILGRHLRFTPRVHFARALAARYRVGAMIDVSDGFLRDLGHLARESGVAAHVDLATLPVSRDARRLARMTGRAPLDHALADGEDHELIFTLPPGEAKRFAADRRLARAATLVGDIRAGRGLFSKTPRGPEPLREQGYDHLVV